MNVLKHHRKTLFFFTTGLLAIAITPAVAAPTIVQTGSNVSAIDGIVINGSTYNVVFGTSIDTTFSTSALASSAATAIDAVLNSSSTDQTVGPDDFSFTVCYSSAGGNECNGVRSTDPGVTPPPDWASGAAALATVNVDSPAADFTLIGVPEPAPIAALLFGGVLVLAANRKRLAPSSC